MQHDYTSKDAERFWKKVNVTKNQDDCWEWLSYCDAAGYGTKTWGSGMIRTHRTAYELTYGKIPDGLSVCHRCDNRKCCNPSHLFLGTNKDNMDDKVLKGRQAANETHGMCKLSDLQIAEIRQRYSVGGESQRDLARIFGIGQTQIQRIVNHKSRV